MNYKEKYLKYKTKYFELKKKQIGGWVLITGDIPVINDNIIRLNVSERLASDYNKDGVDYNKDGVDPLQLQARLPILYNLFFDAISKIHEAKEYLKSTNPNDYQYLDITHLYIDEMLCPAEIYQKDELRDPGAINLREITTIIFGDPLSEVREHFKKHGIFDRYIKNELSPTDYINILYMTYNNFTWSGGFNKVIEIYDNIIKILTEANNKEWSLQIKSGWWNIATAGTQPDTITLKTV